MTAPPPAALQRRRLTTAEVSRLARMLHGQGRWAEAERAYRKVLADAPGDVEALDGLGALCVTLGRLGEAEEWLRRAVAADPRSAEAHNNLGMALTALGRQDEALTRYERAAALDPDHVAARNNLGAALHASGRSAESLPHFETAIRLQPTRAEPHDNLGNALAALRRHPEARACYERALALAPDFAEAHAHLGAALAAMGELDAAIASFETALSLKPEYGRARLGLGRTLGARGRYAEAVTQLEAAIAAGPAAAEVHHDLGAFLAHVGRHEEAVAQFRVACELRPDSASAHNNLANSLVALEKRAEAIAAYREAIRLDPTFAEAYGNLGSALAELRLTDDAMACFERALALDPHLAEVHNNRGRAFLTLGHMADARDAFVRAVALRPDKPQFYRGLASCSPLDANDPYFVAMEALARGAPWLDEPEGIDFRFALAGAYEHQRRFGEAFEHYSAANAVRRRRIDYDEGRILELFGRVRDVFGCDLMRRAEPRTDRPDVPIFILGMPRSGSTLVEQILASHPSVFGAGELAYVADEAAALRGGEGASFPETALSTSDADFRAIGARYRERLQALAPAAPRITDKMPGNFLFVGLIRLALPDARIIHTRRDPVDTCLSCFAQTFSAALPFSNDLAELGRYYRGYAELMDHWRETLPEGSLLEVRYEDLVADFEPQARRLLDHCGLGWDPRCVDFHQMRRPVLTASVTQVRQPLYQRSAGRSRGYGERLRPLLDALGDLAEARPGSA